MTAIEKIHLPAWCLDLPVNCRSGRIRNLEGLSLNDTALWNGCHKVDSVDGSFKRGPGNERGRSNQLHNIGFGNGNCLGHHWFGIVGLFCLESSRVGHGEDSFDIFPFGIELVREDRECKEEEREGIFQRVERKDSLVAVTR